MFKPFPENTLLVTNEQYNKLYHDSEYKNCLLKRYSSNQLDCTISWNLKEGTLDTETTIDWVRQHLKPFSVELEDYMVD